MLTVDERHRMTGRVVELDNQIDALSGWGAAMAAMLEERDGLAAQLGMPKRRQVGAAPIAGSGRHG